MKNNKETRTWLDDSNLNHPLVIAGPNSAEAKTSFYLLLTI